MKFILGKKIEMAQIWQGDKVAAVTKVEAGPCVIAQIKGKTKDGYEAMQIGFGAKKEKNIKKPQIGHMKKISTQAIASAIGGKGSVSGGKKNLKYLREFRIDNINKDLKVGDIINVSTFALNDVINVSGISKGKGFQGVVKRFKLSGAPANHGNKDQLRMTGSIGSSGPAHVFKNRRMPGRMGGDKKTISNLKIINIDAPNNLLYIKGAVPGIKGGLLLITGDGELKVEKISPESNARENKKAGNQASKDLAKNQVGKDRFANLAQEIKDKISQPRIIKSINILEEKNNLDLVSMIAKVINKEIEYSQLKNHLMEFYNFDEAKAGELDKELKEKVFIEVSDYLQ